MPKAFAAVGSWLPQWGGPNPMTFSTQVRHCPPSESNVPMRLSTVPISDELLCCVSSELPREGRASGRKGSAGQAIPLPARTVSSLERATRVAVVLRGQDFEGPHRFRLLFRVRTLGHDDPDGIARRRPLLEEAVNRTGRAAR